MFPVYLFTCFLISSSRGKSCVLLVLGTGALGCVFAARLAARAEVWVFGTWAEGIAAVQRDGIRITERDGSVRQVRVQATTDPADVPPVDAVLLLVKSYQTERAAAWAAQVLRPDGLAVTFQNGLDNGPKLAAAVVAGRAAIGVNYSGATLLGPGETRHTARLTNLIGTRRRRRSGGSAAARPADGGGLNTHRYDAFCPRYGARRWPTQRSTRSRRSSACPTASYCATPERRALLAELVAVAAAVPLANGITLPFADPPAHMAEICRASAPNHTSMLQDVERGRPTEIDSINGGHHGRGAPPPRPDTAQRNGMAADPCAMSPTPTQEEL